MVVSARRSRWILALLFEGEGRQRYNKPVEGRTRLMKELFLLKMTFGLREIEYEFVPYWYGPFSPGVYTDLESLAEDGFVETRNGPAGDIFSLTPRGIDTAQDARATIGKMAIERIKTCKERFNSMPLNQLVAYVYERWPKYTVRALKSPSSVLAALRKEAKAAGITEEDVTRAIAEYRGQAST